MKVSSAALLAAALVSCTLTGVWSFVQPAGVNAREALPSVARRRGAAAASPPDGGNVAAVCLSSSPFEGVDHDGGGGDDEVDLVQREAEQLEELIRGSRGVVVEAIEREWREEMLRVLGEEGERLCSEAYEGYLDRGRGAIFVSPFAVPPRQQRWPAHVFRVVGSWTFSLPSRRAAYQRTTPYIGVQRKNSTKIPLQYLCV